MQIIVFQVYNLVVNNILQLYYIVLSLLNDININKKGISIVLIL